MGGRWRENRGASGALARGRGRRGAAGGRAGFSGARLRNALAFDLQAVRDQGGEWAQVGFGRVGEEEFLQIAEAGERRKIGDASAG